MKKQMDLPLALRPKRRRKKKLMRPAAGAPQCQNFLRKRTLIDHHYVWLKATQCPHHGRLYTINGCRMIVCVCCARRILRKTNALMREIKNKKRKKEH
jgi:hypothetical protein